MVIESTRLVMGRACPNQRLLPIPLNFDVYLRIVAHPIIVSFVSHNSFSMMFSHFCSALKLSREETIEQ